MRYEFMVPTEEPGEYTVTDIKFHDESKTLAIDWNDAKGQPFYVQASSDDEVHYRGTWEYRSRHLGGGGFECVRWSNKAGHQLLLGSWWDATGAEGRLKLVVYDLERPEDRFILTDITGIKYIHPDGREELVSEMKFCSTREPGEPEPAEPCTDPDCPVHGERNRSHPV
jgi:hypothetical protein